MEGKNMDPHQIKGPAGTILRGLVNLKDVIYG